MLDLCDRAALLDDMVAPVLRVCRQWLTTASRIQLAAARRTRIRWRRELAELLLDVEAGVHTLLERRYRDAVERAHGLPTGTRQHAVRHGSRREYKDVFHEEPYGLVVELDGPIGHTSFDDRMRDMRRDNADIVSGRLVLRYAFAT